jgi:geranyl-CoA carboxylase alpha subunit
MSRFDSVLVANRGEIAVRVLRSAQALGYRGIAVYSEADAQAPHVQLADEAVCIGPAPVRESYLHIERIIDAARRTGAGAIHPGYGFLSENAAFAQACAEADIAFIGPSATAIELMGNKAAAKRRMIEAGVPCIPGYQDEDQSDAALAGAAEEIGFPIMVKAAAGGGGRGMRLVHAADELPSALEAARSEAKNAFGSDELILEKAVLRPRHVEVQVFGDEHGAAIHLGERDCSVQRRHQKVVEEAPCPVMTPALRDAMGAAAVAAARSIDYVGAGTVEFLLDGSGDFYFLEMNTRLQVEHPVTELITGLDLVALQLRVAQGEPLPLAQDAVELRGHAIEVRLYAEDVYNDFLPASGTALAWSVPAGDGVRVDQGLDAGQEVSPFYDPMLAKVIAFGADREEARRRLLRALRETVLFGLPSNRQFLIDVLERQQFSDGAATTAFIAEEFPDGPRPPQPGDETLCCAALLQFLAARDAATARALQGAAALADFRTRRENPVAFAYGERQVDVQSLGESNYRVRIDGESHALSLLALESGRARLAIGDVQQSVAFLHRDGGTIELLYRGRGFVLENELAHSAAERAGPGSGSVIAPMHGNVLKLFVAEGDSVSAGDELAVMEAMKMEHRLRAEVDGVVKGLLAAEGQQVAAGAVLLEIEATAVA